MCGSIQASTDSPNIGAIAKSRMGADSMIPYRNSRRPSSVISSVGIAFCGLVVSSGIPHWGHEPGDAEKTSGHIGQK